MTSNETITVSPEYVGSRLLLKLKEMAEEYLGMPVANAVISVPAEFDLKQRNSTIEAANLAGLKILRVINEPTAAAMAYGLHKAEVFHVLVIDLGGGTLDVSLLNKQGGMFLTRAMSGITNLEDRTLIKDCFSTYINRSIKHMAFYPLGKRKFTD